MTRTLYRPNVGPALIALGGALLLTRLAGLGPLELPFLSAVLVAIGLSRRESAWFIPGGILAGIGLGKFLGETSPFAPSLNGDTGTAVFLLSFALGWVGVFTLSRRFGDAPNTWALIPALAMTVIGTLLLSAGVGEQVLEAVGVLWPPGLVALGGYFVVRTQR